MQHDSVPLGSLQILVRTDRERSPERQRGAGVGSRVRAAVQSHRATEESTDKREIRWSDGVVTDVYDAMEVELEARGLWSHVRLYREHS